MFSDAEKVPKLRRVAHLALEMPQLLNGIMMIRVLNIDEVWRTLRIMYTMYLVLFSGVNGEIPVEIGVLFYKYSQNHLFST